MDPVSLSTIGIASAAGGGALSGLGAIMGGQSQAAMYNYQAGIATLNSQIAKQNVDYATASGEVSAQQSNMKTRFQEGVTVAQQGAGGLAIGSGSNARVVSSEAQIGAEDAALIRSNAARKAYGYEVEATQDTAQSQLDTMAASKAQTAGTISAFGSLLGAAGSVSSKWLAGSQAGILPGNSGVSALDPVTGG